MPLTYKIYNYTKFHIFCCRGELYKPETILENLENLKLNEELQLDKLWGNAASQRHFECVNTKKTKVTHTHKKLLSSLLSYATSIDPT